MRVRIRLTDCSYGTIRTQITCMVEWCTVNSNYDVSSRDDLEDLGLEKFIRHQPSAEAEEGNADRELVGNMFMFENSLFVVESLSNDGRVRCVAHIEDNISQDIIVPTTNDFVDSYN